MGLGQKIMAVSYRARLDDAKASAKSMPVRCSAAGRLMSSTQVAGLAAGRSRLLPSVPPCASSSSSASASALYARSGSGGTPGMACASSDVRLLTTQKNLCLCVPVNRRLGRSDNGSM